MRSLYRRLLPALALTLLALAAMTSGGLFAPSAAHAQQQPGAESQQPTLEATAGWTVTLTLTGHTSTNWWFRINWWGTCTAATTGTVDNIGGYTGGPHDVWAYSDSNCDNQIATARFTVQEPALAATVDDDRSVTLDLANGPPTWAFRITGSGTCTPATGTQVTNIRGYQAGTYSVAAFADSACTTYIMDTAFTIPTATLATMVDTNDRSVDLALTGGPNSWWFRINSWGTCTPASGTSFDNIGGYKGGPHSVAAYSDSGCNYHIASSSFTIPTATLTATVDPADWSVDLSLSNGPGNWWFRINWWGTCTPASGTTVTDIRGYAAGEHVVAVFPDANCGSHGAIAGTTFTIPSATLTATVKDDRAFDLTLANGPTNWWFRINSWGTCTPASGTTVSDIRGYAAGEYDVWAYSDSGCTYRVAPLTLTLTDKPTRPAAPSLTPGNAQIAAAWTAPSDNGSAITDYDMQYRATGAANWTNTPANGATYAPGNLGDKSHHSNNGVAVDLGTVAFPGTGLTVEKVTTGGISNVYKINGAMDSLRVRLSGTNEMIGAPTTYQARYAASAPAANALNSHGTQIWAVSGIGMNTAFSGNGATGALTGDTYFWIATPTIAEGDTGNTTPVIVADVIAVPSTLSADVTGLTNGTEYELQVRATNAVGTGDWSPSATLKAGLPAQPAAPALAAGNTELDVSWTAPSDNGSAITDYDLRYSSDGGATWTETADTTDSTSTTATITGLPNGTSYVVQVRAGNTHGDGAWSPSSAEVAAGAPAAPAAPALTTASGQITVTWTAPDNGGSPITDYDLRHSSDSGATWTFVENGTSTSTTATVTGLTDGTAYEVQVRAENARGAGGWSPSTTLATLTAGNVAGTTATLTFAGGSHTGDWYVKETSPATNAACSSVIASTTTTHDLSALTRNTAYTYQAYSDSGCTTAIAIVTFSTLPSSLTASSVSNETATLTISSDHSGDWYLKETSPSTNATCSTAISGTTHNLTGLTDGAPHVYRAYSDSECTTAVAQGTFTTTLYAPTNVSHSSSCNPIIPISCTTNASWSRNSNTAAGAVGYKVQRTNTGNTWTDWHTVQPTTNASLSHSAGTFGSPDIRVRAFRVTGSVTVYSAWVQ